MMSRVWCATRCAQAWLRRSSDMLQAGFSPSPWRAFPYSYPPQDDVSYSYLNTKIVNAPVQCGLNMAAVAYHQDTGCPLGVTKLLGPLCLGAEDLELIRPSCISAAMTPAGARTSEVVMQSLRVLLVDDNHAFLDMAARELAADARVQI